MINRYHVNSSKGLSTKRVNCLRLFLKVINEIFVNVLNFCKRKHCDSNDFSKNSLAQILLVYIKKIL